MPWKNREGFGSDAERRASFVLDLGLILLVLWAEMAGGSVLVDQEGSNRL